VVIPPRAEYFTMKENQRMKSLLVALAILSVSTFAYAANPVSVGGVGADFSTIQAAIDSWCVGGANAAETPPFVINVDPAAGPYDEHIDLDDASVGHGNIVGDLVIQSSVPGTYVVLKLQASTTPAHTSGIQMFQSTANITWDGFLFTPSMTAPVMTDYYMRYDENATSAMNTLTVRNCLFTERDGAGNPLVTTRQQIYSLGAPSGWPTEGHMDGRHIHFWPDPGELASLVVDNCAFYGAWSYTIYARMDSNDETVTINNCCFGASDYHQLYIRSNTGVTNAVATVTGTDQTEGLDNCTVFLQQLTGDSHQLYYGFGQDVSQMNVSKCVFHVFGPDRAGAGTATRNISGTGTWITNISDCIISNAGTGVNVVEAAPAGSTQNWERITFDSSGTGSVFFLVAGGGAIVCRDVIFSGVGTVWDGTAQTGGIDVDYCAYVESGPDAITARGTIQTDGSNIVTADPQYAGKNPMIPDFFDVLNSAYEGQGTAGSDLVGGADFAGGPPPTPSTSVESGWEIYR